ncbi:1-phosphatidylinositol phosphodiesterase-like, partial [Xiphophorus hellerii]|uniref:1-phosphatidylinositol phosphodiesterase-like n=1 Tax=Xiphophorus hellerii TaxID=8084 RepID=UPI0013B417F4
MESQLYLWLFSLLPSCVYTGVGFNDKSDLDSGLLNRKWMASIPDATPVSAIAVPGTHESLTLSGGPLAVTQVWTLEKQLNVGIRYLDIHAGIWFPTDKQVGIRDANWLFSQGVTFTAVVEKVLAFLDENGGEAVLMKVTLHGLYQDRAARMVEQQLQRFKGKIWRKVSVPELGQVRGKIVFLQNRKFPLGTENHRSYLFESNQLKAVEEKLRDVRWHLCGHYVLLTQTAAAAMQRPKALARSVNRQLSNLVRRRRAGAGCLGVISMDFPSAELIRNIIRLGTCGCGPTAGRPAGPERPGPTEPGDPGEEPGTTEPGEP